MNNFNVVPYVELESKKSAMTRNEMEICTQKELEENPQELMDVCAEALSNRQYGSDTRPAGHMKSLKERKLARTKITKAFKKASPISGSKITPIQRTFDLLASLDNGSSLSNSPRSSSVRMGDMA